MTVEGETVGQIGPGALVLAAVEHGDDEATVDRCAAKVAGLRFFGDDQGRMNRSAGQVEAALLVVSQFTLAARLERGRRPSFERAAPPEVARGLLQRFCERLERQGLEVAQGRFGASMQVELVNDGPVTLIVES